MRFFDRLMRRGRGFRTASAPGDHSRGAINSLSSSLSRSAGLPSWLSQGGAVNPNTGMGVQGIDKSEGVSFAPTYWASRRDLEVLYVQSWACQHFVDMPIDDMLIRGRSFVSESETAVERMREEEQRVQSVRRLKDTMKAGRLFGTGLLLMVTREAPLDVPLDPLRVRRGDLLALHVFDRFCAAVYERDEDIGSPEFGQPVFYELFPDSGQQLRVHASRVIRFDGQEPLTQHGWEIYDRDWGVSSVIPVIASITQDETLAAGAAHLAQESSIPVVRMANFTDAVAGELNPSDPTPMQYGEVISRMKSIYRTLFMDSGDSVERLAVSWGGYADIMDRAARRVAAAAGIPATRFWSQSPLGMNATGDSDMANYRLQVAAERDRMLTDPVGRLDEVVARSAGLPEPLEYEWELLEDEDPAVAAKTAGEKAKAVQVAIMAGLIDEDEGRAALDGDSVFGELPEGMAPGLPEPEPEPEPGPGAGGDDEE